MKLDYSKISDVEVAKIDLRDCPDFTDAFIEAANYDGRPMTDDELEELNNDSSYIHELVIARIY